MTKPKQAEQRDETRICKECAHSKTSTGLLPGEKCIRPNLPKNLVTGKPDVIWCSMERIQAGGCGPSGKFYEPKPEPCKGCADRDKEIGDLRARCIASEGGVHELETRPFWKRWLSWCLL